MSPHRRREPKRLIFIVCASVLTVALAVVLAVVVFRHSRTPIASNELQRWNASGQAGVIIPAGAPAAEFTFAAASTAPSTHPEAPIAKMLEVVAGPVDITPRQKPGAAAVVFKLDPAKVPTKSTDASGKPQRNISGVAIQVFDEKLKAWITLDTQVAGNTVRASAPHFSLYRAVWLKLGQYTINGLHYVVTAATKLTDMLWQTFAEAARQFHRNMSGKFDEAKAGCGKESEQFEVTDTNAVTRGRATACVKEASDELLVANRWAVPMLLVPSARDGVTPLPPSDKNLVNLLRNAVAARLNGVIAPGVDTAGFALATSAPEKFTVTGRMSWAATILDMELAFLNLLLPEVRAVQVLGDFTDSANCLVAAGQKLAETSPASIPASMAELARKCLVPLLVNTIGAGQEILAILAKTGEVVPQMVQTALTLFVGGITGRDITKVTFTVEKTTSQLEWMRGEWACNPPGLEAALVLKDDDTGVISEKEYVTQTRTRLRTADFHVKRDKLIVDRSNLFGIKTGDRIRVKRTGDNTLLITNGTHERYFVRASTSPYC